MKKVIVGISLLLFALSGFSQSAMVSAGGYAKSNAGSVSSSIGQVATLTVSKQDIGSINEGIQVPYIISTVGVDEFPQIQLTVVAYPNPTTSGVTLRIDDVSGLNQCVANVYDAQGQMINQVEITESQTYIQMQQYVAGLYYVTVNEKNRVLKQFKIVKK